jgi:hypothetical protein
MIDQKTVLELAEKSGFVTDHDSVQVHDIYSCYSQEITDEVKKLIELSMQLGSDQAKVEIKTHLLQVDNLGNGAFSNGFRQAIFQLEELLVDIKELNEFEKCMQDAIDANRYRYLRDTEMWGVIIWESLDFPNEHGGHAAALDSAVDASIRNRKDNHEQ